MREKIQFDDKWIFHRGDINIDFQKDKCHVYIQSKTEKKVWGANGYRTSHYPHSEAVMDALNELGFIVLDEKRWFESTHEGKAQFEKLINRDRM